MNIDELFDNTSPHASFHDSIIQNINLNYEAKTAVINFSICVGDINSSFEQEREARRSGQLLISDILYCIIEPPDNKYPYTEANGLWVADAAFSEAAKHNLPTSPKNGALTMYFFINDWNSFVYISAMQVKFEWVQV